MDNQFKSFCNQRLSVLDTQLLEEKFSNIKLHDDESIVWSIPETQKSYCSCNYLEQVVKETVATSNEDQVYDIITSKIDPDIKCPICQSGLDAPCSDCFDAKAENQCFSVTLKNCSHSFHRHCISRWISRRSCCPVDNLELCSAETTDVIIVKSKGEKNKVTHAKCDDSLQTLLSEKYIFQNGKRVTKLDDICKQIDGIVHLSQCSPDSHTVTLEFTAKFGTEPHFKSFAKFAFTVRELRDLIASRISIFPENIKMQYGDLILLPEFDQLTLYQIGFKGENEIHVSDCPNTKYEVHKKGSFFIIYPSLPDKSIADVSDLVVGRSSWLPFPYHKVPHSSVSCLLSSLFILFKKVLMNDSCISSVINTFTKYLDYFHFSREETEQGARSLKKFLKKSAHFNDIDRITLSVLFFELICRLKSDNEESNLKHANVICELLWSDVEPNNLEWEDALKIVENNGTFAIMSPLALKKNNPPLLTHDETLHTVIFVGRGKSNTLDMSLYDPLMNKSIDINPDTLAKQLFNKGSDLFIDDRIYDEAIVLCVDTSSSMNGSSDFEKEEEKKTVNTDGEIFQKNYYDIWTNIKEEDSTISQRLLKDAIIWFVTHPCFSSFSIYTLREVIALENNHHNAYAKVIASSLHVFRKLMRKGSCYVSGNLYLSETSPEYSTGYKRKKSEISDDGSGQKSSLLIGDEIGPHLLVTSDYSSWNLKVEKELVENRSDLQYYIFLYYKLKPCQYQLFETSNDNFDLTLLPQTKICIYSDWSSKSYTKSFILPSGAKIRDIFYKSSELTYFSKYITSDWTHVGDNYYNCNTLPLSSTCQSIDKSTLDIVIRERKIKPKNSPPQTSRLETVKKLFDIFTDRSIAYGFNNAIGLLSFNSTVTQVSPITPYYEIFRSGIKTLSARGDTCMRDAILKACEYLSKWKDEDSDKRGQANLRVICLSDGKDTCSEINEYSVINYVRSCGVVVDSIFIGDDDFSSAGRITDQSGGYCFNPKNIKFAMKIMELETILSSKNRENVPYARTNSIPLMQVSEKSNLKSFIAERVPFVEEINNARIIKELKTVIKNPHPFVDVYVNDKDLTFWKLIFTGPVGSVYINGTWLAYLEFPKNYPNEAPVIRFNTPIKHCNINNYGKVCHSIFDRNYDPSISVVTIINYVYGLLLSPDVEDPLDNRLAELFYSSEGEYEAKILGHVKKYASKTREEWKDVLDSTMD